VPWSARFGDRNGLANPAQRLEIRRRDGHGRFMTMPRAGGLCAYGTAPDRLALLVGLLGLAATLLADARYLRSAIARRHFSFLIDRAVLLTALAGVAAIALWRLIGSRSLQEGHCRCVSPGATRLCYWTKQLVRPTELAATTGRTVTQRAARLHWSPRALPTAVADLLEQIDQAVDALAAGDHKRQALNQALDVRLPSSTRSPRHAPRPIIPGDGRRSTTSTCPAMSTVSPTTRAR
jgi:hypothetical protein